MACGPTGIGEFANDSEMRTNPTATVRLADGVRRIHMPGEPDSPDTVSFIRTLPEAESFELLDAAIVGRVGFVAMRALVVYE